MSFAPSPTRPVPAWAQEEALREAGAAWKSARALIADGVESALSRLADADQFGGGLRTLTDAEIARFAPMVADAAIVAIMRHSWTARHPKLDLVFTIPEGV